MVFSFVCTSMISNSSVSPITGRNLSILADTDAESIIHKRQEKCTIEIMLIGQLLHRSVSYSLISLIQYMMSHEQYILTFCSRLTNVSLVVRMWHFWDFPEEQYTNESCGPFSCSVLLLLNFFTAPPALSLLLLLNLCTAPSVICLLLPAIPLLLLLLQWLFYCSSQLLTMVSLLLLLVQALYYFDFCA